MTPEQMAEATLKAAQVQAAAAQWQTAAAWVGTVGGLLTLGANVLFAIRSGERERRADEQAREREAQANAAAAERIRAEDQAARQRETDAERRAADKERGRHNDRVRRAVEIGDKAAALLQAGVNDWAAHARVGLLSRSPASGNLTVEYRELFTALEIVAAEAAVTPSLWSAINRLERELKGEGEGIWLAAVQPAEAAQIMSHRREVVLDARDKVAALRIGTADEQLPPEQDVWRDRPSPTAS